MGDRRRSVAKELGRSKYAVQNRYGALKLNSPRYLNSLRDARFAYEPWLPCEDAELRKLSALHVADVAADLDRSISGVRNREHKLGIKRGWHLTKRAAGEALAVSVYRLRRMGVANWQVAERLGITTCSASALYHKARAARGECGRNKQRHRAIGEA